MIVDFEGAAVPVGEELVVVVVPVEPPDLGGYLIPELGQDPDEGASIGTNVPSIREPFRLK